MHPETNAALLPPRIETDSGAPRRIGIEIEFIGLDVASAARLVADFIGGEIDQQSRYECAVKGDPAGDWRVELDSQLLKDMAREAQRDPGTDPINELAEALVRMGAEAVVPVEIVTPPIAMTRLAEVSRIVAVLRESGARGTGSSIAYAFGLHLNPELPSLDTGVIVAYLKAFLCLFDWLRARSNVDGTRWLTPYIAAFPDSYVRKVISLDCQPDQNGLIDDYLADNATRNRALDMLPLFAHLDEARVRSRVNDARVKARPTLHYRLPNCEIDRADWGLEVAWRDWLQVECLACDPDRLSMVVRAYHELLQQPFSTWTRGWRLEVSRWLNLPAGR